jgi:bud emergence protein 1
LFGIHEGDIELDYDPRNNNSDAISTTASHTMSRSPSIVPTHSSYGQHIKVKIIHKDDIFAMKVPADCSLDYLRSKVYDRIGLKQTKLKYKNEASGQIEPLQSELDMEEAFVLAIQRGKITVLAE